MESATDHHHMRALLEWQIELGATDCIADAPVDRYALQAAAPKKRPAHAATEDAPLESIDPVQIARAAAAAATDLEGLRGTLSQFEHCDLKKGARSLVFADGVPQSRVMVIGEAPGRDEDREGRPFVGRAGQLLDRMFDAIGLRRETSLYITNILPWRPPQNRDPSPEEIAMMMPFVERHVALAAPEVIVLMGNISCQAVLGRRGITRMRGTWMEALKRPALPMFHPAYLLRNPSAKR
ncbi:MAG: uracil-DNA glycosylase, partial [Pseudomonadota bacterium]